MPSPLKFSLVIACILCCAKVSRSGNILILLMPESLSHRRTLYPFAETLQDAGHQVTLAVPALTEPRLLSGKIEEKFFMTKTSDPELLKCFVHPDPDEWQHWLWDIEMNDALVLVYSSVVMNRICMETIEEHEAEIRKFMQRDWDLILVDELLNPCGPALASLSPAPVISLSTTLIMSGIKCFKGIPYNPVIASPFYYKFEFKPEKFWSRVRSVLSFGSELVLTGLAYNFVTLRSGRRLNPQSYQIFSRFVSNSEMLLTDYPIALEYPQPTRFDVIEAGSYCGHNPKPLPEHFEHFVSDPKSKGTIYMAFGTHVKWSVAPMEKIEAFKEAILRLEDYRIFWQYDGPDLHLPNHIITQKWFPQLDILAHNRTIGFLSHGGLKSLREGICQGVPIVVMPVFAEQMRNALILKEKEAGNMLDKLTLTPDSVESALRSIVQDPGKLKNMGRMRDYFQDHILDGPKTAVFWSEFLIRHQGVPKLFFSNRRQELWFFQYVMLDVAGSFLGFLFLLLFSIWKIMKRFCLK